MTQTADLRSSMAAYIRDLSGWRRRRYDDDLRDPRHLRSAGALIELASHIENLPLNDPRMSALARLASDGEEFSPGQQAAYEIGRYCFHDQEITHDGFLTLLVAIAERDAGEYGRFGGRQAADDDPWR